MKSKYNDDAKERVRQRVNIADVVGRYVSLKRRGRSMVGLCPFHKEKTPSFSVNPEVGSYYCFSCHEGGDVFDFVQEMEGVGFREALEMLAAEAGVELPRYERREPRDGDAFYDERSSAEGGGATKTELFKINDLAAEFFQKRVKDSPPAVDYFKSRGLSPEIVKEFRLGYAPDGWHGLIDHLVGKGISLQRIVECGLAVSKEGGRPYDRFRNRVIFPIFDLGGRVIAFAGRGLDADADPKYLNSSESILYKKSGVLYGLHKARDGIREQGYVIVVEGYMDYLTLYQAGIRNAAAASGTAFTEDHAHLIKRFVSKAALVFDGDRAGLSAAQRTALILAPLGLQVSILALPGDDDPDSFVKREGPGAFLGLIAKARSAEDFLIDKLISESDGSPHGKSAVLDGLMPYANALADEVVREDFLSKIAQRLRIELRIVKDRFKNSGKSYRPPKDEAASAVHSRKNRRKAIGALEEDFLGYIITVPELIISARRYLSPEILTNPVAENIYSIVLRTYDRDGCLERLLDVCGNDESLRYYVSMLSVNPARLEYIEDELNQKIFLLRRKFFKTRIVDTRAEIAACSEREKTDALLERVKYYQEQLKESNLTE